MVTIMRMFERWRRYSLSELPDLIVFIIAMAATAQHGFGKNKL